MEHIDNLVKEEWETRRETFINLCNIYIKRKGIKEMLDYLDRTDFYTAPCSTKYHLNIKGGLCKHSINVMDALFMQCALLNVNVTDETIAIVSLFHDICKINTYKEDLKWSKDEGGQWVQIPCYTFEEKYAFGHGEKSAIMVQHFLDVTPYELQAINAHMGFSDQRGPQLIGNIFKQNQLAVALHFADMVATYFREV